MKAEDLPPDLPLSEVPEQLRGLLLNVIPFMAGIAKKEGNIEAYLLLFCEERAMRCGAYALGSILSQLATAALYHPPSLREIAEIIADFTDKQADKIEAELIKRRPGIELTIDTASRLMQEAVDNTGLTPEELSARAAKIRDDFLPRD